MSENTGEHVLVTPSGAEVHFPTPQPRRFADNLRFEGKVTRSNMTRADVAAVLGLPEAVVDRLAAVGVIGGDEQHGFSLRVPADYAYRLFPELGEMVSIRDIWVRADMETQQRATQAQSVQP